MNLNEDCYIEELKPFNCAQKKCYLRNVFFKSYISNICVLPDTGLMVREFAEWSRKPLFNSRSQSYQRLKKWYLMPPCLTLNIIRYGSRIKWNNLVKGVARFPTSGCSSYWKGSLQVILNYGCQLYFTLYVYWKNLVLNNPQRLRCHKTQPN